MTDNHPYMCDGIAVGDQGQPYAECGAKVSHPPHPLGSPVAAATMKIDVYPVGVLAELHHAWRYLTARRFPATVGQPPWAWRIDRARTSLRHIRQTIVRHVRARNWRALKNTFNGYLAEPDVFPPGDYRRRCGTGWTKRRALRSLVRRLPDGAITAAVAEVLARAGR